jgi:hypothetical protein
MQMMDDLTQQDKGQPVANRLQLAGVIGLVAPLAATLGLFKATGTIGRIQRDEPIWLLVAIALVLVAGGLLTIASYFKGKKADGTEYKGITALFVTGAACTVLGFGLALGLVIFNASDESRPRITASLNQAESKLTAQVVASNLKTSHRLVVKIDLATLKPGEGLDDKSPFIKGGSRGVERAYVGPNADGEARQVISLPVPAGGPYTDILIRAFTGKGNSSCQEEPVESTDPGTACMFLALDRSRGTATQ